MSSRTKIGQPFFTNRNRTETFPFAHHLKFGFPKKHLKLAFFHSPKMWMEVRATIHSMIMVMVSWTTMSSTTRSTIVRTHHDCATCKAWAKAEGRLKGLFVLEFLSYFFRHNFLVFVNNLSWRPAALRSLHGMFKWPCQYRVTQILCRLLGKWLLAIFHSLTYFKRFKGFVYFPNSKTFSLGLLSTCFDQE